VARSTDRAKATLIRYADDCVIPDRKITPRLESFVSEKIEQWLGLKINRDKTRIYEVKVSENGLDFLGYNFSLALALLLTGSTTLVSKF
jgi:RNA-directed DNA polymerase